MPEEKKPKAKLIKQSRPTQTPSQTTPVAPVATTTQVEKKKVVIVKKKPVVVVKTQPQDNKTPEKSSTEKPSTEKKSSVDKTSVADVKPVETKPAETKPVKAEVPEKKEPVAVKEEKPAKTKKVQSAQEPATKPAVSTSSASTSSAPKTEQKSQQTVLAKKVVKKSNAANTVINNGPVIISGANLPPILPKTGTKTSTSKPVGSVGGVYYGKDGKAIKPRVSRQGQQDKKPITGTYTPRGNQKGPFNKDKKDFHGTGFKPGFSKGPSKNSFVADVISEGKNKRVFSKDKGRDRRHEQVDDELELKQIGRKKSAEPQAVVSKNIDIMASVTVSELAKKMNIKASEIISKLFSMGMMVSINQSIDSDTATIIAGEYGCEVHLIDLYEETVIESQKDNEGDLVPRAPIVTVMGHVDHGKTKLLDAIRQSNVVEGEFGGITQHIGAYKVHIPEKGDIVFLDTPGHAAFTMMRARGAQITDIVVLVVAANDGVMPQTLEAIDHAKAANVPIIVALNKIDLPEAKPERVMQQLSDHGLMPEEWGGKTLYCQISAKHKMGIDNLLDTILLQAEMMELKSNPKVRAEGKVLEARIDQGRGIVASVIIQRGTLRQGDYYVAGIFAGRVRAMFDDRGRKIKEAAPSTPVEVIGLSDVPNAGDPIQVCEDEKQARSIGTKRQELERLNRANQYKKVTLENMFEVMHDGEVQELNLVIKGDVQGSVEALQMALEKLSTPEIRVRVIRAAAGAIIEDDINLASASENPALVIGFNVRPTPKAQARADEAKIDIRKYNIIYNVVDDVKAAMEGMLSPERTEVDVGTAQVRQVFKVPKVGLIAGCMVLSGTVKRNNWCRVVRDNIQMSKELLKISSLKRFKDDAKEVAAGFECGVGIENYQDLKEGDIIEFVEIQETARKLEDTGMII